MIHTREHAISTLSGNPTDSEIAKEVTRLNTNTILAEIRHDRNERLSRCDWRFLSDQTPSAEWIEYRQALRDMTNGIDITNITWPLSPDENN